MFQQKLIGHGCLCGSLFELFKGISRKEGGLLLGVVYNQLVEGVGKCLKMSKFGENRHFFSRIVENRVNSPCQNGDNPYIRAPFLGTTALCCGTLECQCGRRRVELSVVNHWFASC